MEGFTLIAQAAAGQNCVQDFSLPREENGEEIRLLQTCDNTDLVLKLSQKIRQYLPVKEVLYAQKYYNIIWFLKI